MVTLYHIDHQSFDYLAPNLYNTVYNYLLPTFYFISGFFFRPYKGFNDFLRNKVNQLIVPFVFFVFFAFAVRLVEYGLHLAVGFYPVEISLIQLIEPFYLRYWPNTAPMWFLLSLFWAHVIFYAIQNWVKPFWGVIFVTFVLSVVGYLLARYEIMLPLMLDTSLVVLPYLVLGWVVNRYRVLLSSRFKQLDLLVFIVVWLLVYWLSDFYNLHFLKLPSYWKLYLLPFVAVLSLFRACRHLPYIPVLCYYGRFTLIILCTHPLILQPIRSLLMAHGMTPGIGLSLLILALTMLLEWPLIWLLKTYAPRFTAQKPFFKEGWKIR